MSADEAAAKAAYLLEWKRSRVAFYTKKQGVAGAAGLDDAFDCFGCAASGRGDLILYAILSGNFSDSKLPSSKKKK